MAEMTGPPVAIMSVVFTYYLATHSFVSFELVLEHSVPHKAPKVGHEETCPLMPSPFDTRLHFFNL